MAHNAHDAYIDNERERCSVFVAISLDQSPFVSELDVIQVLLSRAHHILPITPFIVTNMSKVAIQNGF